MEKCLRRRIYCGCEWRIAHGIELFPLCEAIKIGSIEMHYAPIDRALTDFGFWSLPLTHVDLGQRCQCKSCSQLNSEQTYTCTFLNLLRFDRVIWGQSRWVATFGTPC